MFQAEVIAVRAGFKAAAPCTAQRFPELTQLEIIGGVCFVLAIHEQIKVHGQALGMQTVGDAAALFSVKRGLFRRAVRLAKGQAIDLPPSR